MCCSEHLVEEVAMSEQSGAKVEVYAAEPGAELVIGTYGVATNEKPARVPAEKAAEFKGKPEFRVVAGVEEEEEEEEEEPEGEEPEAPEEEPEGERPKTGKEEG